MPGSQAQSTFVVPIPVADQDVANKQYVDSLDARITSVVKKVDEIVSNSTVFQNDDELFIPLLANTIYSFKFWQIYLSTTVADFKTRFIVPAAATGLYCFDGLAIASRMNAFSTDLNQSGNGGLGDLSPFAGRIIMGANAGNFQIAWAQQTAEVSNTTMLQGATLEVIRET